MIKTIVRETTIILLIILAIILTLCVLLYDYVPTDVQVPETKTYATSANIQEELASDIAAETTSVVLTYEIDGTDLNNYERIKEYEPGKVNPFSSYEVESSDIDTNQNAEGNTSNSDNSTENTTGNTQTNSGSSIPNENTTSGSGSYFKNTGTK